MNPTTSPLSQARQDFITALSGISRFWGFPKGMGAIFGVLYLSPIPLSLDDLVAQTGLTKGAISTEIRALARMGLVHRSSRLGDRKDYYEAETDFYTAIRSIIRERQSTEFDGALRTVRETAAFLRVNAPPRASEEYEEWSFLRERVQALQDFFTAIDGLASTIARLESLGVRNIHKIMGVLK